MYKMQNNNLLDQLENVINNKKNAYNYESINSWFNGEKKYKQRYKGREILEIIQNAEDAAAEELIFTIDRENHKIIISNNGAPFSLEGYSSLMYPDLSSKPKGVFIGQKGLGFRALINWAKEISIISNNLKVTFSEELSQELLNNLKNEHKELSDINQMQFLSIPQVEKINNDEGVTFELVYKDGVDFEKQFEAIDKECLFFLSNLKTIKTPISIIQKDSSDTCIIEEKRCELPYEYYEKEELEKKETQKISYEIKLIWNSEKNYVNFPLYCYFKTNVKIGSPVLIHAGFDLSDDRNSIEETPRNKFLVDEICKLFENLIDKIAIKYNDWSSYKVVNHYIQCQKDSIFESIRSCFTRIKQNKSIYPTIDGKLKTFDEIIVLDNEIVEFIIKLKQKYTNIPFYEFDNIVKPVYDTEISLNINKEKYYEVFTLLSRKLPVDNIEDRSILIKLFYEYANTFCGSNKPSIFIDNNNEIIPEDDEVFSHNDEEIDENLIPSFCKYRTINSNLNRKLINEGLLSQEEIESCIKKIYPGNITNIFLILIDYLAKEINESQKKEIYLNLFKMYKKYRDKIDIPTNYPINILCDDDNYYSENIIFNYGFNSNDKILDIIGDFIKENSNIHCIQKKEYWNFLCGTDLELREFFRFLGVSDSIDYEIINEEADLFLNKLAKENIIKLAILDCNFFEFIKSENIITNLIKTKHLFTDYVINTKKINFLNNGLLDRKVINDITRDESKLNTILKNLGAQETIETISAERFNYIIKNLYKWDPDGEVAGRIYDQAFKREVKIKGETLYFSKDRSRYLSNKELYYYDNKCLPTSKLKEFPTIDLGRRKGHEKVSNLFNIKSIETYKVKLIRKPDIDYNLTDQFVTDLKRFYHLILAYRFCSATNSLSEEMKKEQANALNNINIQLCKNLEYTLNNELNKEILQDFDFVNSDGIFYLKVPEGCKKISDIRKHKKELYDFISEMLLMTFKLTENNSYIKDTAVQTYIFNDISFSISRFEDDNDRTILREAEDFLNITNYREEFWKHIWQIKNIDEPYEIWEDRQDTKKSFSTLDYTIYNEDMEAIFDEDDVLIDKKEFFKDYAYRNSINFLDYNLENFRDSYNLVKNDIDKYIWFKCNKKKDKQIKYLEKITEIQWDSNIAELFTSYNYYIEDYKKEMWKKLKEISYDKDIIYEIINQNSINEQEIYNKNCAKYTKTQLDIIKEQYNTSSLLYFENTEDRIKEILEDYNKFNTKDKSLQENSDMTNQDCTQWSEFSFEERNPAQPSHNRSSSKSQKTTYSSIERATNDIKKGQLVEQQAMEILNKSKKYSNVKNVSEWGYGYDIQCMENMTKRILYIEVKSFEKDYFEMTENEYKIWEKNKNIYRIFLLKSNTNEYNLINGEELENYFDIESCKYRFKTNRFRSVPLKSSV